MSNLANVKIIKIVKELQKIRETVKCSICLETVKEPLQVGCSHIFCSECFKKYEAGTTKGKNCLCPVCRSVLQRRKKRQHNKGHKVAEYVEKVGDILSNITNCNVFEVSEEQIQQNLKLSYTPNSRKRKSFIGMSKRTVTPSKHTPKKSKLITTIDVNTKKVTKLEQKETKSPSRKCQRKPSKKISHSTNVSEKEKVTPKKDPFDLLLESSNILPHSTFKSKVIKTYSAKSKTDRNHVYVDKVVEFQDNTNKTRILHWLSDTRNKFDNITLTQTQNEDQNSESSLVNSFDMPSISQVHKKGKPKVNKSMKHVATQNLHTKNNKKNLKNKRAASLDRCVIRKVYPKHRLKRHSIACESQDYDNMIIETVDSESECRDNENSKKHWSLLEEQCLRDIENNTPKRGRQKLNKSKKDPNTSVSQKSQWDRLKSIGKRGRKMKKLNVSQCNPIISESNKERKGNVLQHTANDITIDYKHLQETDTNFKKPIINEANVVEKNKKNEEEANKYSSNKTYDLDAIETYFIEKLTEYDENKNPNEVTDNYCNNLTNNSKKQNLKPINNTNCVLRSVENIKSKKNITISKSDDIKKKLNYSSKPVIIEQGDVQDKNDINIKCIDLIEIHKVVEQEEFKGFKSLAELETDCSACNEKENEEEIFKPTQVFLENFKNLNESELNENLNSLVKKLFNEIKFQKQSQSNVNIDIFEPILTAMKFLVEKVERQNEWQSKKNLKDVHTQTNILEFCNSSAQTIINLENVFTQTDPMNGFYISSNESFKTPAKIHVEIQTECLPHCTKCNMKDMKPVSPPSEFKRTLSNDNNNNGYQFTESLDNINFETQDILNQNQIKVSQPLNKFVFKSQKINKGSSSQNSKVLTSNLDKDANKKGSQVEKAASLNQMYKEGTSQFPLSSAESQKCLVISVMSQKNSSSSRRALNQVFNNMEVENKNVFKRIRKPESDSDSDSEIHAHPKKICNKFLNNDLSLKFESQCDNTTNIERQILNRNEILSCDSDNIDYEEFLEKVLKKYDDPPPSVKPLSKTEDIIERCEKIIREATMLRPQEIVPNVSTPKTEQTNKLSLNTMQEFNQEFSYVKSNQANSEVREKNEINANVNPFSLSLFGNSEEKASLNRNINKFSNSSNKTIDRKELDDYVKEISNEFEKSFDEDVNVELADLHENIENKSLKQQNCEQKVTVLQDIKLNNFVKKPEKEEINEDIFIENFDDSFENIDIVSHKSDDMFDDVDVVESTPQKSKKSSNDRNIPLDDQVLLSETKQPLTIDEDLINCLNMTFTPPPGFQDAENPDDETLKYDNNLNEPKTNTNESEIKKFTYGISSLTPDLLLEPNPPLKRNQQLPETSTPNMLESDFEQPLIPLSLSPIKPPQKEFPTGPLNPIDIAKSSKFSPLMIVKSKRPPQRVLTPQSCTPTQKSILNYVKPDNLDASPQPGCSRYSTPVEEVTVNMKPCVSCTRLTLEQVMAINSLASKKLLCYSGSFSKSVTHMIVATNAKGCVKDHTMKYVFAVAAGIWVLSFNWIEECLKRKCLVPEDPFEVKDVSGLPGPRLSRLALKRDLLKGFKVYAAKPFVSTTAEEVENVVTMLGGKIVSRLDDLLSRNGYIPLIITEARASQDFELYESKSLNNNFMHYKSNISK
ncbi:putative leucine-rich repeat-containing protein DDB_G0290503 [Agrilus planipennis]|uniref:Leucine-rich repeat-containing protein DDB_G0290503 n=1 Tax=Agrilus planipennis TaxID=224129 RepID=A0A7F5R4T3_AGRPL|nr:putative leucine-rich repeat-containing protein DDB_G0290503 [Agrilus planipennis]